MGSGLFQAQCQRHKTGLTHTIAHTGLVYMATSPFPPIVDGPNGSSSQYDLDRLGKHTLPPLLVGPQSHMTQILAKEAIEHKVCSTSWLKE